MFLLRPASKYFGACALVLLAGCASRQSEEAAERALADEAKTAKSSVAQLKDISFKNWELAGTDANRRPLWKIKARQTRIGEGDRLNPRRATLLGAVAELFRDGQIESRFQAARIDFISTPKGLRLQMSEGVKAQSVVSQKQAKQSGALEGGPIEMTMPRADVDVDSHRLFAGSGAQIEQGQGDARVQISAQKLKADSGLAVATLSGLKAVSRGTTTEAKTAIWNWKTGRVQATGEVRATRDDVTLRGERLQADTQVAAGVLSGGVRAQSKEGRASCGEIHFRWRENALSARRDVRLERDGATLSASRIDTDLKLDGAVASGGVAMSKDGATMSAQQLQAFDKMTRAIASGGVRLNKNGATLNAARIETWDKFTRAVASGDVRLGRDNARVAAGRVEAFNLDNQSTLRILATRGVTLWRDDLRVRAASVTARGLGDRSTLNVEASGNAEARNNQGSVQAKRVTWFKGRVIASDGVTMRQKGNTLSGARLESDDKFQNATLSGGVRGSFASGGSVRANGLNKRGENITAQGSIVARRERLTLRGGKLETTLSLEHAVLTQNVELRTSDGAIVRAPSLRYEKKLDKAYGSGGVSFADPSRGLRGRGRKIVINRVSDPKRREAILTEVQGGGNERALGGLKLF